MAFDKRRLLRKIWPKVSENDSCYATYLYSTFSRIWNCGLLCFRLLWTEFDLEIFQYSMRFAETRKSYDRFCSQFQRMIMRTYSHLCSVTYTRTHTHSHTHSHRCTHSHKCTYLHSHGLTLMYSHIHTLACWCICKHTLMHAHSHIRACTKLHTCAPAYAHMHKWNIFTLICIILVKPSENNFTEVGYF